MYSLKAGNSPGADNILSELLKNGGEAAATGPDDDMQEHLRDEGMDAGVNTVGHYTPTKERQPRTMPGLSYHQPNQPPQQLHDPSFPQPTQSRG